jgi:hypothetical protein
MLFDRLVGGEQSAEVALEFLTSELAGIFGHWTPRMAAFADINH